MSSFGVMVLALTCPDLESPAQGDLDEGSRTYLSTISYRCMEGHHMQGDRLKMEVVLSCNNCTKLACTWNDTLPPCTGKQTSINEPVNTKVSLT